VVPALSCINTMSRTIGSVTLASRDSARLLPARANMPKITTIALLIAMAPRINWELDACELLS